MTTTRRRDAVPDLFATLGMPSSKELKVLHDRLVAGADAEDLLDVAYCTVDSPVGTLLLAATTVGIVRIAFQIESFDLVLQELSDRIGSRILLAPSRLDDAARQLDEYFDGHRHRFDLPLDLRLSTGFRRIVLTHLGTVEFGTTTSYGEVAIAVDHPRAARAVGTACATNPLPLVVPCHRVIRTDGVLGSYLGGTETKRRLLALEAAA